MSRSTSHPAAKRQSVGDDGKSQEEMAVTALPMVAASAIEEATIST